MRPLRSLIALCLLAALPAAAEDPERALHVLNRLAYGPRPGDMERVGKIGVDRYIQDQLSPQSLPENPELQNQLRALPTQNLDASGLFRNYGPSKGADKAARQAAQKRAKVVMAEAAQAKVARALLSQRQLEERLVDFWFNHFNVTARKGNNDLWTSPYERLTIRPRVLGRFRELLGAAAKDPAMLVYLDNAQAKTINENYARELMELHTMGVDGGYTQSDVVALAKIFSGWGVAGGDARGRFAFKKDRHDFSHKVFLGKKIKGRGQAEGEEALDILARHPATAKFICRKLAQYFVQDDPPAGLVDQLAAVYQATDGDVRTVLAALFHSEAFWAPAARNAKFKTPYEYVVSCLRAANVTLVSNAPTLNLLRQMGMPLYECPTPDGYKDSEAAWLNPDGLMKRINFAVALAAGRTRVLTGRAASRPKVTDAALKKTLDPLFEPRTMGAVQKAPPHLRAALLLGSPEMMRQ